MIKKMELENTTIQMAMYIKDNLEKTIKYLLNKIIKYRIYIILILKIIEWIRTNGLLYE